MLLRGLESIIDMVLPVWEVWFLAVQISLCSCEICSGFQPVGRLELQISKHLGLEEHVQSKRRRV